MALVLPAQPDSAQKDALAQIQRAQYFGRGAHCRGLYRAVASAALGDDGFVELDVYAADRPPAFRGAPMVGAPMGQQQRSRTFWLTLKAPVPGASVAAAVKGVLDGQVVQLLPSDEVVVPATELGVPSTDGMARLKVSTVQMRLEGVWHAEATLP